MKPLIGFLDNFSGLNKIIDELDDENHSEKSEEFNFRLPWIKPINDLDSYIYHPLLRHYYGQCLLLIENKKNNGRKIKEVLIEYGHINNKHLNGKIIAFIPLTKESKKFQYE